MSFGFGPSFTQKTSDPSANKMSFQFGGKTVKDEFDSSASGTTSVGGFQFGEKTVKDESDSSGGETAPVGGFTFGAPSTPNISNSAASEQTSTGGFSFGQLSSLKISDSSESEQTSSGGTSKLIEDFKNLFVSGEDSDVTIKVKDTEFRAHKIILRARSSVFNGMFSHDMVEQNSGTVNIIDCEPEAFKIYLLYLYSGSVENLTTYTMFDLYKIAEKYDAGELKLTCKKFMVSKLSVDTVCDVIEHSLQYNEKGLLKTATQFFTTNFKEIIQSVKWQSFLIRNPVAANELFIAVSDCYVLRRNKKSSTRSINALDT